MMSFTLVTQWPEVLKLISHSLKENQIPFVIHKSGKKQFQVSQTTPTSSLATPISSHSNQV